MSADPVYVMHKAVEDVLVDFRDRRIGTLGAANGLVIREADGTESAIVRMSTRDAMTIALAALQSAGWQPPESER